MAPNTSIFLRLVMGRFRLLTRLRGRFPVLTTRSFSRCPTSRLRQPALNGRLLPPGGRPGQSVRGDSSNCGAEQLANAARKSIRSGRANLSGRPEFSSQPTRLQLKPRTGRRPTGEEVENDLGPESAGGGGSG